MKIIRKSLLALLLGLSLTACGISRNKIINTEFTRATEAESQVSQFVSGTPSETTSFDYSMVPEYTGSASVAINNNVPFFNADEKAAGTSSFETYSELDDLRRCGTAYACIGKDIMPTEERGQIGMVKPTGWHTVKYDCCIIEWIIIPPPIAAPAIHKPATIAAGDEYIMPCVSIISHFGQIVLFTVSPI